MLYSKPQDIMFDDDRIDKLKKIKSDSQVIKNFFSQDEIEKIISEKENSVLVNKLGSIVNWKYSANTEYKNWLEEKFQKVLPHKFTQHGGNYFKTSMPFFVHTDTGKEEVNNLLPYKNIVVPLTQSSKDQPCYTVLFKQRWYGQSCMFWKGPLFKKSKTDYNYKLEDYSTLENFTNRNMSINEYTNFLTHLPYNNLHGLSVECVYEWNIGDIIIFDCTQLHSSNDFTSKGSSSPKFALSYFCRVTDD